MRGPFFCAMLAAAAWLGMHAEAAPPRRPNVLFMMCDDLCCALACYGDATARTPNIDRLAARGVRFERAYCQFPLCNPSRASLLSGRRPARTAVRDNQKHFRDVDASVVTLPQAFRQAGWRTERIGKLYHYSVPAGIGTSGLDDPPSWDAVTNPKGRDVFDEPLIFSLLPGKFGGTVSWLAADGTDAEQTDGLSAAHAVTLLEGYARERTPFFLAVGFYRPHTPYVAPKKWFDEHPRDAIVLPEVPADHDARVPPAAVASRHKEQVRLVGDLGREALQAYRAGVSFVDAQVGIVLDALDRLGLRDDTIVVFTSDHGYHLGEHGLWQKRSLFEESARVPLVIAAPGGRRGAAEHTVELVDVMPTVCDLAGVPVPTGADGRSVAALVRGNEAAARGLPDRPAFTETQFAKVRGVSMRSGKWRYTVWNGGAGGRQLYDHEADPRELDNLAERPEHAATLQRLDAELRRHHPEKELLP
jgi:iduronate 2-sulfatase